MLLTWHNLSDTLAVRNIHSDTIGAMIDFIESKECLSRGEAWNYGPIGITHFIGKGGMKK